MLAKNFQRENPQKSARLRCNLAGGVQRLTEEHRPGSVISCFAVVAEGRTAEILVPELLDSIAS